MNPTLTSPQNPKIKNLLALEKARERRKQNRFLIEGLKELTLALTSGYSLESVFYNPELVKAGYLEGLGIPKRILFPVSKAVFDKIAYRESSGGVLAIAIQQTHDLEAISLRTKKPFILILEGVEKPGNLGAILRTADAAAVDAVIICDPQTDFYNPNVVRSSLGCVFTNQVAAATTEDTLSWLKKNNISIFCTYLKGSVRYDTVDYNQPCAIVMGTESTGLTESWTSQAHQNIIIPMRGKIDSMNVSVSAAIVVFEAMRQRGFEM